MILSIIFSIFLVQYYCDGRTATDIDDISADLDVIRTKYHMPGLSALAMKNGRIVAQGASGYRRQDYPTPLLADDYINIGSCTKWMTATLAGRLVDRQLLKWTIQINECFPNYKSFNEAFHNMTLEEFLAHRSGVADSDTFFTRHADEFLAQNGTYREIRYWTAETILKDEPQVKPGEYLYSNQGYAVAAAMMEQVTNKDWESLMQEYIFNPLDMTETTIRIAYNGTTPPQSPAGHVLPKNSTLLVLFPILSPTMIHNHEAATGPGGFVATTLQDWVKFLYAHITAESTGFLSADTAAKLKRPFIGLEGYGLGVAVFNRTWATPGQALMHGGDIAGQDSIFWMTPARDGIAVAYTNCASEDTSTASALDETSGLLVDRYIA